MTTRTTRPGATQTRTIQPCTTQPFSELPDQGAGFTGHTGDAR